VLTHVTSSVDLVASALASASVVNIPSTVNTFFLDPLSDRRVHVTFAVP
jgi:hypothetical protein